MQRYNTAPDLNTGLYSYSRIDAQGTQGQCSGLEGIGQGSFRQGLHLGKTFRQCAKGKGPGLVATA